MYSNCCTLHSTYEDGAVFVVSAAECTRSVDVHQAGMLWHHAAHTHTHIHTHTHTHTHAHTHTHVHTHVLALSGAKTNLFL